MSVYTEEEAKTKWCPFARQMISVDSIGGIGGSVASPIAVGSANRFEGNRAATCLASGCMAWRSLDEVAGLNDDWTDKRIVVGGFCGLAGKP